MALTLTSIDRLVCRALDLDRRIAELTTALEAAIEQRDADEIADGIDAGNLDADGNVIEGDY